MADTSPTRMALLQRRTQLGLARKGVDLLEKKRDALIAEFFGLVREALAARKRLDEAASQAYLALFLAQAFDGPESVAALAATVPLVQDVSARVDNVWGTNVPYLEASWSSTLASSPIATGSETLKAQQAFSRFAQALVDVANTETRLRRMGEEIQKTNRRVNALEQVVIPGIRTDMRFIQQALEEREHEDIFRLKRIKGKS